jgi:predicted RND superfamily exporter protein
LQHTPKIIDAIENGLQENGKEYKKTSKLATYQVILYIIDHLLGPEAQNNSMIQKAHAELLKKYDKYKFVTKQEAIEQMVGRMGIVTLFCNITAAIGFFVFALTKSPLLKEFGWVSGLNIMALFLISLLFIPPVLTFLPPPTTKHVKYLENKYLERILIKIERWTFQHTKWVFAITSILVVVSIMGLMRIKKEAFIVDDLPKKDTLYIRGYGKDDYSDLTDALQIIKSEFGFVCKILPPLDIDSRNIIQNSTHILEVHQTLKSLKVNDKTLYITEKQLWTNRIYVRGYSFLNGNVVIVRGDKNILKETIIHEFNRTSSPTQNAFPVYATSKK